MTEATRSEDDSFVSIIIPTYNCAAKLAQTLDSVLAQEGAAFEVLIIDGASKDGTLDVIRDYASRNPQSIRWISQKDCGIYDAMNHGIDLSRGKYLYFLGAGDRLRPAVLGKVQESAPGQGMAMIYGNVYWVSENLVYDGPFDRVKLAMRNLCHQAVFYDRDIFGLLGKYDIGYPALADYVLNMRCFRAKAIQKIYIDGLIVADYEGMGVSDAQRDQAFLRKERWLQENYLGVCVKERPFFTTERFLATQVRYAHGWIARKFWHLQLMLLHTLIRPLLPARYRVLTLSSGPEIRYSKITVLDEV